MKTSGSSNPNKLSTKGTAFISDAEGMKTSAVMEGMIIAAEIAAPPIAPS